MRVTATQFQQNVGRYQDAAQIQPVEITKNGRVHTVLLSATLFELVTKGRIARAVQDLDEDTIAAIAGSETPAEFAPLDDLLKDWTP